MENVSLRTVYRVNTDACVCVLVECSREGEGECEQTVTVSDPLAAVRKISKADLFIWSELF